MTAPALLRRIRGASPLTVDVAVALAVALAMTLIISVAEEDSSRDPDVVAYALGVLTGALLLARRYRPLLVLAGSVGTLLIYYSLDYPAFSPAFPLAAASYAAATAGRSVPAALVGGGLIALGTVWQLVREDASALTILGQQTLTDGALLAAVLLLGEAVRHRRAWAAEVEARLARAEEEREREARLRVEQERLRIARDLHDVVSHTIAGMTVQAAVAADALETEPDEAREALAAIREHGRTAMSELRATVGLLRDGEDAPRAPAPGLRDLDGLVRLASAAGVEVEVETAGAPRPLPPAVDLTAYRIVQESLTNVIRHAEASRARVAVRYDREALDIEVRDDGRGLNGSGGASGHGMAGMRERAAAVGGTVSAGPAEGGGFRVHARLPAAEAAR